VLRADNHGEGGILALVALVRGKLTQAGEARALFVGVGLFGAALLYGDGMITPAISVLSAVEGLEVADARLRPTSCRSPASSCRPLRHPAPRHRRHRPRLRADHAGLVRLVIAGSGRWHRHRPPPGDPRRAVPLHAVRFFCATACRPRWCSARVVLAITGGEALYADMGHFGARRSDRLVLAGRCRRWCSTTSARARCMLEDPPARRAPFFALARRGRCCRWSSWRRWRR
jgi:KUP system potassium uptake protein